MYTYQKALLYSCRNIKGAIKECDRVIEYSAISSKYSMQSCLSLSQNILQTLYEKQKLIDLKNKLLFIVKHFTKEEKKLFAYKYLGIKQNFKNLSTRQYFREQNKLLKNFSSTLRVFDLDEKTFMEEYYSIPYINDIYSEIVETGKVS